jgi:TonB-dependent SusC/RagA subfamily outer membrane receptor
MVRPVDNLHYGHLFLSEVIPEGNYTIRAYTRYMENLGDEYFFKKNIWIGKLPDPQEKDKQTGNKKKRIKDDYDVSFFPEGGYLLQETLCKVGFKALNINGYPEYISGKIVDEEGKEITNVSTLHAGMGLFALIPEQGKKYYLECQNLNQFNKRFEIPAAETGTYSIHTGRNNKMIYIDPKKAINSPDIPLYILIHCRGHLLHFSPWDKSKKHIAFADDQLPSGVIQILLLDKEMNPLSERLIFNKNEDQGNAGFITDKASYEIRDKVTATLSINDTKNNPLAGNLSIAITDDKDIIADSLTTILSTLLLSSELKGHIEAPAYYLQDDNKAVAALDLLMMTHGWRRYAIPEALIGNYTFPEESFEVTKSISGEVKSLVLGKPVENSEVTLFSTVGDLIQAETNKQGKFLFYDFEFPDSTTFFVQSLGKKGKPNVELVVQEESFPVPNHISYNPYTDYSVDEEVEKKGNEFIKKAEQRAKYDENIRIIHLKEVEVTAQKIDKKNEARLSYWANASSDFTLDREKIEQRHATSVTQLLHGIAGVRVGAYGEIQIRGVSTLSGKTNPLVLIDGIPMEWPEVMLTPFDSPLESVDVHSIESIDVFKGASAAIFGMRGSNGAISITTRRGNNNEELGRSGFNYTSLSPLGFQKPVEFYSPKYETPQSKHLGNPDYRTTIFWKPDIIVPEEGKASFEFYTSDFPTTYSVIIEGLSIDGKIIRQVEKIKVK